MLKKKKKKPKYECLKIIDPRLRIKGARKYMKLNKVWFIWSQDKDSNSSNIYFLNLKLNIYFLIKIEYKRDFFNFEHSGECYISW